MSGISSVKKVVSKIQSGKNNLHENVRFLLNHIDAKTLDDIQRNKLNEHDCVQLKQFISEHEGLIFNQIEEDILLSSRINMPIMLGGAFTFIALFPLPSATLLLIALSAAIIAVLSAYVCASFIDIMLCKKESIATIKVSYDQKLKSQHSNPQTSPDSNLLDLSAIWIFPSYVRPLFDLDIPKRMLNFSKIFGCSHENNHEEDHHASSSITFS